MKVLIQNNLVHELYPDDVIPAMHPDLAAAVVDADPSTSYGYMWDGTAFVPNNPHAIWDGSKWVPETAQQTIDRQDAELEALTASIVDNDKRFKVIAATLFQVLKAANTSDFTEFAGVTNAATFRQYLKDKLGAA